MSFSHTLESLASSGSGGYFGLSSKTSLKVGFRCNAPRTTKTACSYRRCWPHPVRRGGADRAVVSAPWAAGLFLAAHPFSPEKQSVQRQRTAGSVALSADLGRKKKKNPTIRKRAH